MVSEALANTAKHANATVAGSRWRPADSLRINHRLISDETRTPQVDIGSLTVDNTYCLTVSNRFVLWYDLQY